jgi:SulP family sulfate permease
VNEGRYFPNARFIEELVNDDVAGNPATRYVTLECPAVNVIDSSALESLEAINRRLKDVGIELHLSEVKGPVTAKTESVDFKQPV